MEAYIRAISYYLPEKILSNENLVAEFPEWTAEKVAKKVGINQRHIAAEDEFVSDMATKAAKKLFQENNIAPASIDFVLLCTQSPDYFLPTTACLVQHSLGIPTTAGALDFNQGCSGFVYGLSLAKGLIAANIAQNVLLITAETYTKHLHQTDKGNRTIFGDAAAAALISTSGKLAIQNFSLGTDGSGYDKLIVKNGGLKSSKQSTESLTDLDDYLYMDGSGVFNFTIDTVPDLVQKTLQNNHIDSISAVDWFVFHQANAFMLNHLRKKLAIPDDQFLMHMEDCGNTVSSTLPIVLSHHWSTFKKDQTLLLAGFGVGLSWAGVVLKTS